MSSYGHDAQAPLPRRRPAHTMPPPAEPTRVPPAEPTRVPPAEPMGEEPRSVRFLGLPLPAWIIAAAVSIVVIIAALAILPRLGGHGGGTPPAQAAPTSGASGVGEVGSGAGQVSGAPTAPAGPVSPHPSVSGSTTAPPSTAKVEVSDISSVNQVVRMKVTITLRNPGAVPQGWRNVSVQVDDGLSLLLEAITPGTRVYDSGRTVCVEPTAPATIAAGGTAVVEFYVNRLLSTPPHKRDTQVDNPVCVPPQAS